MDLQLPSYGAKRTLCDRAAVVQCMRELTAMYGKLDLCEVVSETADGHAIPDLSLTEALAAPSVRSVLFIVRDGYRLQIRASLHPRRMAIDVRIYGDAPPGLKTAIDQVLYLHPEEPAHPLRRLWNWFLAFVLAGIVAGLAVGLIMMLIKGI